MAKKTAKTCRDLLYKHPVVLPFQLMSFHTLRLSLYNTTKQNIRLYPRNSAVRSVLFALPPPPPPPRSNFFFHKSSLHCRRRFLSSFSLEFRGVFSLENSSPRLFPIGHASCGGGIVRRSGQLSEPVDSSGSGTGPVLRMALQSPVWLPGCDCDHYTAESAPVAVPAAAVGLSALLELKVTPWDLHQVGGAVWEDLFVSDGPETHCGVEWLRPDPRGTVQAGV